MQANAPQKAPLEPLSSKGTRFAFPTLTALAHYTVHNAVHRVCVSSLASTPQPCCFVGIDATCGNGHDTVFLAQTFAQYAVDTPWQVLGFDIQQRALANTHALIAQHPPLAPHIKLHAIGHQHLKQFVPTTHTVCAAMFNLGYLPRGNKSVITTPHHTIDAITAALVLLAPLGVITVHCYGGHLGGAEEMDSVANLFTTLSHYEWTVTCYSPCNKTQNPEALYLAQKKEHHRGNPFKP